MTKNRTTSSTAVTAALPTLGDRPGELSGTSTSRPRRRLGRKAALLLGGAVAVASLGGTGAYAAMTQFSDVPSGHTFESQIAWMVDNDIASGYPDGTFKPGSPITRGSAAAFLSNYNSSIEIVYTTSSTTAAQEWLKSATCPDGKRAIAGGGNLPTSGAFITESYPDGTQWKVRWETDNNASVAMDQIRVYAVCAPGDPIV